MKTTLSKDQFINEFRQIRPDNFSYEALETLFEYFEMMENDCDLEMEFDPIAICCDYSEDHYTDIIGMYNTDITDTDFNTEEEQIEYVRKFLNDKTSVVGEPSYGVFVYQQF